MVIDTDILSSQNDRCLHQKRRGRNSDCTINRRSCKMSDIKVGSESSTSTIDIDLNTINDESRIRNTFQTFKSILFRVIEH